MFCYYLEMEGRTADGRSLLHAKLHVEVMTV